MIGLGVGCTVLGIVLGVLTFRYYKLNASSNYNDDDEEDLEQMGGNNETSRLENKQAATETEQLIKFYVNNFCFLETLNDMRACFERFHYKYTKMPRHMLISG